MTTASVARTAAALAGAATLALALAACAPEPFPGVTVTPAATPSSTAAPSPSATPVTAADEMTMPGACEQAYSPDMLAVLQASGPLNDAGIELLSTRLAPALEIIESGAPTLRCTWGAPGEPGLATNITQVTAEQALEVRTALVEAGYGCEDLAGGVVCRIQSQSVDFDDNLVTQGETHYLRGDGLVTTAWIDFDPDGYTEDIAATLWD